MRKERFIRLNAYLAFAFMVLAAFFVSFRITKKDSSSAVKKENFLVLREGKEVSALYFDGINVWVGGNDGVIVYDEKTLEEVRRIADLKLVYSTGMEQTPDGMMWIGHEDGVTGFAIVDGKEKNRIDFSYPDIPKGRVNTIEWDGKKLWIGTYDGAACLVQSKDTVGWKVEAFYGKSNGLCSDSVNVIRKTQDSLWFASYLDTESGGISIMDGNKMQCLTVEDGLPHPYITSLENLGDGRMLVGTGYMDTGGLALIQRGENGYQVMETYGKEQGVPGEKVRQLFLDSRGYLWITTEYDGILVINYKKDELKIPFDGIYYTEENGLSDNEIKCIVETDENYWLGGKYGLTLIPKQRMAEQLQE